MSKWFKKIAMDFDINESAGKLAKSLDGQPEKETAQAFLGELSRITQREDRASLLSRVDSLEEKNSGLDLILKRDNQQKVIAYTILPSAMNESARTMATLMDAGNVHEAMNLAARVKAGIGVEQTNPQQATQRFAGWSIAVDAYEQDGVGEDVSINYYRGRSTNPKYSFKLHRDEQ